MDMIKSIMSQKAVLARLIARVMLSCSLDGLFSPGDLRAGQLLTLRTPLSVTLEHLRINRGPEHRSCDSTPAQNDHVLHGHQALLFETQKRDSRLGFATTTLSNQPYHQQSTPHYPT